MCEVCVSLRLVCVALSADMQGKWVRLSVCDKNL